MSGVLRAIDPGVVFAVITITSVLSGSVSARPFSSMNRFCGERMATSLCQAGSKPKAVGAQPRASTSRLNCSRCSCFARGAASRNSVRSS